MRAKSTSPRWKAVCLSARHHSFTTKAFTSYSAAEKFMSRHHPTCTFELVALPAQMLTSQADRMLRALDLATDELVGD